MTGEIKIIFDTESGKVGVSAPMQDQEQKNFSISKLLIAIEVIMNFKPSALITPGSVPPKGKVPMRLAN